jgi:putative flippase GtrA
VGFLSAIVDPLFTRFVLVGVLNTAFGYLMYALLLWMGLNYATAAGIGTILGVLFNFKSIGSLVFGSENNRLMFRFIGVYTLVYLVNLLGLWALTANGFSAYSAGLVTLAPAAILAFTLNKKFVFGSVK